MATLPTALQANTSSKADKTIIVDAANKLFIDGATFAINQAIMQGKFRVFIYNVERMDISYIRTYFTNLGYTIAIPNYNNGQFQPAALFGEFWNHFWLDPFEPFSFFPEAANNNKVYQVLITWHQPTE